MIFIMYLKMTCRASVVSTFLFGEGHDLYPDFRVCLQGDRWHLAWHRAFV